MRAAGVKVEINGLPEEQRDAVRASLELNNYDKRDISPAELRAAYRDAEEQIKRCARAFWLLRPEGHPAPHRR